MDEERERFSGPDARRGRGDGIGRIRRREAAVSRRPGHRLPGQVAHQVVVVLPVEGVAQGAQRGYRAVDLGRADGEGRLQPEDMGVVEHGRGDEVVDVEQIRGEERDQVVVLREERHRVRVIAVEGEKLETDQVAGPAHVPDHTGVRGLQRAEPLEKVRAVLRHVAHDLLVVAEQEVEGAQPHPGDQVAVGERRTMERPKAVVPRVGCCDAGADRDETAAQRLGQHEDVRRPRLRGQAEEGARPAKPGLDFVHDAEHAVPAAQRERGGEVARRSRYHSRLALDRLQDERGNPFGVLLERRLRAAMSP